MNLIKTNLVQAQEYTKETNDTLEIIELCKNKINNSLAVPSWLLSDENSFTKSSHHTKLEWYNIKYPCPYKKPEISVIDIYIAKQP